jgi:hypothetical protein
MTESFSRRAALKTLMTAGSAFGALAVLPIEHASAAADAAKPHLTLQDPTAVALAYTENGDKVDASKFPTYKPGQHCGNCMQSKGDPKDAWLACNLFPGKMVAAKGWCKVYVKKP